MSVKNFKFVSPGVFINEIDNSFIPKSPDAIGPVIIGRAERGLAMQPVKVESYSDFVTMFGDTVPGNGGGDVYRDGNYQSPMYGTYAAKAFLRSDVAPITYIRLLGFQHTNNTAAGRAGWSTVKTPAHTAMDNGGAYGLWLFHSGTLAACGTGSLGAIWYLNSGSVIYLSGNLRGGGQGKAEANITAAAGAMIGSDSSNLLTAYISGANEIQTIKFNFDDTSEHFIRKKFNTNPQLASSAGTFYPASAIKDYWLGETFEQDIRDDGVFSGSTAGGTQGIILAIRSASSDYDPSQMKDQSSVEAKAGWFIAQDLGQPGDYVPFNQQKLFRLIGRGHGEWLHKNLKVSIYKIRQATNASSDYGSFSLIIRMVNDTDNVIQSVERYDNLTLDPSSPNFIARIIGDQYYSWDDTERRLSLYGDYPNMSKFIRVEMNADVEAGATDPVLLPFGYFGPPKFSTVVDVFGSGSNLAVQQSVTNAGVSWINSFITGGYGIPTGDGLNVISGGLPGDWIHTTRLTASLKFPSLRLRVSASDGGLSDARNAYFGFQNTRTVSSTRADSGMGDPHRRWYAGFPDDPTSTTVQGVDGYAYVFSLDDIVLSGSSTSGFYYESGSRAKSTSYTSGTYTDLLNSEVNAFTAPFWGGFDAFDIKVPDPLYNKGMSSTSTSENSYAYNTLKRAIDTVSDPEFVDMNLLTAPGVTLDSLTTHMVRVCEERADAMALIDLADVFIPSHEQYYSSKSSRVGTTPTTAATALKNRQIDSSYGATFYPWLQGRDEETGKLVWVPPSVAMMGVLASSERKAELWFAPAGFNRGGLSEGAAGMPILNISERLTSKQRDLLYESNINPIASFPSSGIVVFGQKTLQERQSALDRINVRRLVIFMKKQISILATKILFEQNVQATWTRFKGLVTPFLDSMVVRFGITDYRLILDSSTTTPDLIDQNILYAKIMIKPARAIEYIAIDFVIMSTGASFDD
jgi:hypothetical protein